MNRPDHATVDGIKISGDPRFQAPIEFEFDPKANVFIGPNATGKSTILKILRDHLPSDFSFREDDRTEVRRLPRVYLPPVRDVAPADLSEYSNPPDQIATEDVDVSEGFLQNLVYEVALLKMEEPEFRYSSKYSDPLDDSFWSDIDGYIKWFINGASLWRTLGPLRVASSSELQERANQIEDFPSQEFWNFISKADLTRPMWQARRQLLAVDGTRFLLNGPDPNTSFPAVRVKMALDVVRQMDPQLSVEVEKIAEACCRDICPEVFRGVNVHREQKHVNGVVVDEKPYPGMGFIPAGKSDNSSIHMGETSTGTQGLWWWINWLTLQLAYPAWWDGERRRSEFHQRNAILLIDEIENHLHPTWQRRVIPALLKHFPGLQIFATTHSPFVVAGLKRGQIHRLYREEGVIKTDKLTVEEKEQRIRGWSVEEILQEFMDVVDPTDEATAEMAATLRWLREQAPSGNLAKDWVTDLADFLEGNHERTLGEELSLRWLTANRPDDESAATAEEWWMATTEQLYAMIGPELEDD